MPSQAVDALIHALGRECSNAMFALYEPCHPTDGFGTVMCQYFRDAGTPLCSVSACPAPSDQRRRFQHRQWATVKAASVYQFVAAASVPVLVPVPNDDDGGGNDDDGRPSVRRRRLRRPSSSSLVRLGTRNTNTVEQLEPFDEYEELDLAKQHSLVLCAINDRSGTGLRAILESCTGDDADDAEEPLNLRAFFPTDDDSTVHNGRSRDGSSDDHVVDVVELDPTAVAVAHDASSFVPVGRWGHSLTSWNQGHWKEPLTSQNKGPSKELYVFGGYGGEKHQRLNELLQLQLVRNLTLTLHL